MTVPDWLKHLWASIWICGALLLGLVLASPRPVVAQGGRDVTFHVDSFSGDSVWETKYGRLDNPNGCGRTNLAIVWRLTRGPTGRHEAMQYLYFDTDSPFHHASAFGAVSGALNIDGRIFSIQRQELPPHARTTVGINTDKSEDAVFMLPDSTLRAVQLGRDVRIRLVGLDRTCDGAVEQNMKVRLAELLRVSEPVVSPNGE